MGSLEYRQDSYGGGQATSWGCKSAIQTDTDLYITMSMVSTVGKGYADMKVQLKIRRHSSITV